LKKDDLCPISPRAALRWRGGALRPASEALAVEEPLEIRLGGRRFTLTMRTPGHDEEIAAGFLFAEGFIASPGEIAELRRVRGMRGAPDPNALDVILKVPSAALRERLRRNFAVTSSCGVCGKTSIEALRRRIDPIAPGAAIAPAALVGLDARMLKAQRGFAATGGLHAAALFSLAGKLELLREDIGRHNAVDKVIGRALMDGAVPLAKSAMVVSGRASFEIVQKAAAGGVPILAGVSAPSSLAVELAEEVGMTLVGFLRESGFNVYTHPERVPA
jgi:FdhD protein